MKVKAGDLRKGDVIKENGNLLKAISVSFITPGRRAALAAVVLQDMIKGNKYENTFTIDTELEKIEVYKREFKYLYGDENFLHFMNTENFEQVEIQRTLVDEKKMLFIYPETNLVLSMDENNNFVEIEWPQKVVCEVAEADTVIKGQTASSSQKNATLINGVKIKVPSFVTAGEKIVVKLEDMTFVERYNEKED